MEPKAEIYGIPYYFFKRPAQRFASYTVSSFMADNGKEFINKKLATYLTDLTIKHNDIHTYTTVIIVNVERVNRTIIEGTRSLTLSTNVSITLAGYAAQ